MSVGSFFKSMIGSNKDANILSNLFVEKGLTKKAEDIAVKNLNKKTATDIKNGANDLADMGKDYTQSVNDITQANIKIQKDLGNKTKVDLGRSEKNAESIKYSAADKVGSKATQEEYDAALKSVNSSVGREAAWETAKGYYADPWKRMTNSTLSKEERNLAMGQLSARVGATAGGVALTAGMTHDLISDNEEDVGLGGIAGNALEATVIGAGGVSGIGLLRKL